MRIETFGEQHLAQAAALGASHLRDLRHTLPLVPERWTRVNALAHRLESSAVEGRGLVALEGDDVVGYMAYALFPFKGQQAAFSPEYAHATISRGTRRINEALYTTASRLWADDGRALHMIAWTPNDAAAEQTWLWQGFGLLCVDALRDLSPIESSVSSAKIRPATKEDVAVCQTLGAGLGQHLCAPSVFCQCHTEDEASWQKTLADPARHTALAEVEGKAVGYIRIGPAHTDACTIIEDAGTASITGAYVAPEHRGEGIAAALLDHSLAWARARGYQRCAVDFESANTPGARFWTRHFSPVVLGAMRYIDLPNQ